MEEQLTVYTSEYIYAISQGLSSQDRNVELKVSLNINILYTEQQNVPLDLE